MIDTIRDFLKGLSAPSGRRRDLGEADLRLAVAALLVHCMAVDGEISASERAALRRLLERRYALSGDELERLVAEAKAAEAEAVDLYGFTSVIKRATSEEERIRLVEQLWEMAYADGESHEFEDNLLWRVSELLGVDRRTRIASRIAVAENAKATDSSSD